MTLHYVTPSTWATSERFDSSRADVDLRDTLRWLRTRNAYDHAGTSALDSGSGSSLTALRANYVRCQGGNTLVTKLRFRVNTQLGQIQLAVYDGTGVGRAARPNTRQAWTEIVDCPGAGNAELALNAPVLLSGDHWIAIVASAAVILAASGSGDSAGIAMMTGLIHYEDSAMPLPLVASVDGAGGSCPMILGAA